MSTNDAAVQRQGSQDVASAQMPRYKCHKEVWALKIKAIFHDIDAATLDGNRVSDGSATITPEEKGFGPFKVDLDYMSRNKPEIGGYYVQYADGYKSYSPASTFESGYTAI